MIAMIATQKLGEEGSLTPVYELGCARVLPVSGFFAFVGYCTSGLANSAAGPSWL
jgi:hypothetical protein